MASLKEGLAKARQLALDEALRNAVQQYAGVTTASSSTIHNDGQLQSKISSRTHGVVKHYKVIRELNRNGVIEIQIVAEIVEQIDDPKTIARAIREHMGRPSIYIESPNADLKQILADSLVNHDLDITNDSKQARYILQAKVNFNEAKMTGSAPTTMSVLTLAIKDQRNKDDAIRIRSVPEDSWTQDTNAERRRFESMEKAVSSIESQLTEKFASNMVDSFNNGSKVNVTFNRLLRLRDAETLRNMISGFPLVKQVNVLPQEGRSVSMTVLYLGDPNELQLMILKNAQKNHLSGLRSIGNSQGGLNFTF